MSDKVGGLLDASEHAAQPRDRRKKKVFRFGRDRRKQAPLSIGLEVSPNGLSFSLLRPQAQENATVVEYFPFHGNGAWSEEWLKETLGILKEKYRLYGQAVVVALGGDTCITRAWFGENEVVDANIAEITERTNHYIALGRGEKICCYKESPVDAKNKRAWVTVAHRGVVHNVATAINGSGLRLVRMEHALASTCAAVGYTGLDVDEPILVAAGEEGRTNLAISYRGHLILDYRPPAAIDTGDGHDAVIQVVRKHIKRLRRFAMRSLPNDANDLNRICFPGVADISPEVENALREDCGLTCVPVPLDSICSGDPNVAEAISENPESLNAVWLAKQGAMGSEANSADISKSLNGSLAISWRDLGKTLWPIAAVLMLLVGAHAYSFRVGMKVTSLERELESLQPDRIELTRAKLELTKQLETSKSWDALKEHIKESRWNEIVRVTARALPKGTWLNTIRINSIADVQVSGTSFTDEDIFEYVQSLKNSKLFQRVSLGATKQVRTSSGPGLDFELTLTVIDDFLESKPAANEIAGNVAHFTGS